MRKNYRLVGIVLMVFVVCAMGAVPAIAQDDPSVKVKVNEEGEPMVRLDPGGEDPSIWDVVCDDTFFYIRDTSYGTTPFGICRGFFGENRNHKALWINHMGDIGIGTDAPGADLHISRESDFVSSLRMTNGYEANIELRTFERHGQLINSAEGGSLQFFTEGAIGYPPAPDVIIDSNGNVGIGVIAPNNPLEMASGAHCTAEGVWTNVSSREYKENIHELSADKAMSALEELTPVEYNYKVNQSEQYVGFIAEDVPDLVATSDRKGMSPMDVTAVLTKVVQEQQKMIEELSKRIDELEEN